MAKIGVSGAKFRLYEITQDADTGMEIETPTGAARVFAATVKIDNSVDVAKTELYADNAVAESIRKFTGGKLTPEVDDIAPEVLAEVLGHQITTDKEVIYSDGDLAPLMRFGFIIDRIKKNKPSFRAVVYMRVQFGDPNDGAETQDGSGAKMLTTSIEGSIMRNASGDWKRECTFDTKAAAVAYVDKLLNFGEESA